MAASRFKLIVFVVCVRIWTFTAALVIDEISLVRPVLSTPVYNGAVNVRNAFTVNVINT